MSTTMYYYQYVNRAKKPISTYLTVLFCLTIFICFVNHTSAKEIKAEKSQATLILDGESFNGRIRAKGIIGIFSVKGTLSFKEGILIWDAKKSKDKGPYLSEESNGLVKFSARLALENNEFVDWSGVYDGNTVFNVKAVWKRNKGDFIHDLFLPDEVVLVFSPLKNK